MPIVAWPGIFRRQQVAVDMIRMIVARTHLGRAGHRDGPNNLYNVDSPSSGVSFK